MKMKMPLVLLSCCGLVSIALGEPIKNDIAGAKDNPLLKRYEGSFIFQYSQKAFDEYSMALGRGLNPSINGGKTMEKTQSVEGRVTRISYLAPMGRSTLEVLRNYEEELKEKGFETLYAASNKDLGYDFQTHYAGIYHQVFDYATFNPRYLAARLSQPEGDTYVAVFATGYEMGTTGDLPVAKGQTIAQVDIVEAKPMESKMVNVSAEKMASALQEAGRVALYGIYFDFNKADVKPESAPTLEQIGKLMAGDPSLKLLVTGHTDNVGSFEFNRGLSERRAQAVVRELLSRYQIANERLFPFGVSFAAPAAPNDTEENRAKNRRVELVRM